MLHQVDVSFDLILHPVHSRSPILEYRRQFNIQFFARCFLFLHKLMEKFRLTQGAADVCIMLGYGNSSPVGESPWTFRPLQLKPQRCVQMSGTKTQQRRATKLIEINRRYSHCIIQYTYIHIYGTMLKFWAACLNP